MKRKLPIGTSDFKKLIQENCYFIDKSLFIRDIIDDSSRVILIPRPRRFGKTLNLSMLRYFFDVEGAEENRKLFEGLKIYYTEYFKKYFGKYPVIFLTFKDCKGNSFERCYAAICDLIQRLYEYHKDKLLDTLTEEDKRRYFKILRGEYTQTDIENSLFYLTKYLYKSYSSDVVVLIDEYDTPVHSAYANGYYKDLIDFIKNLLSAGLKDNDEFLHKAVLTGILRVSKESIFSGLNNPGVYTILDVEYSNFFGLTEQEIKRLLDDYEIKEKYDEIAYWYNGYIFGETVIYNPWSAINYIASKKKDPKPYWINTSSNAILRELIEKSTVGFRKKLELLIRGESIETNLTENIIFPDLTKNSMHIYSLLFFSGYLKCVNRTGKPEDGYIYHLQIPNKEVSLIYREVISLWIEDSFTNEKLQLLLQSLVNLDIKMFERILSEFVRDTFSYFDVTKQNEEAVYQAFLLGLLVNLTDYDVRSNRESGYGRVDIMLLHKTDKNKPAIIMELKSIDEFAEETKDSALDNALKQIEEKQYEVEARKLEYANIRKFGVVFDGKRVWIKER